MVAVRQVLLSEITSIWNTFASSQERSDLEEKMKKDSASDDDRARQNPAGYLPGLKFRLAFRMVNELLDELRQSGVQESEMRMAFLGKLLRLGSAGGIFAHEGRHAIDKNIDSSLKSPELEFRAKLSEVAFSPRPRWMIISLLSPNIGDSTPHGQANQRVMRGIISWMKEHSEEIERLDQSRPMLPQLDLLTDDQVVSAMRSMDPLAKNQ